jgi:2-dehydro-3-deoxyphosphooctonate aldolase (KDO 8-P synthase)
MIGDIDCGADQLFLIAGPCVIEEESLMMRTAERLKGITQRLGVPLIFKSSFSKDNRSSLEYYQGPGLEAGLRMLEKIKRQFELPILTDIHYPYQAAPAAEVCDVIQIPAYLCMQSELVVEAAKTGAVVNIKHGQFLAPENMAKPVKKIEDSGNDRIILTERGYTFGYNDLVVDPRSFYLLNQIGYPVVLDSGHAIRK